MTLMTLLRAQWDRALAVASAVVAAIVLLVGYLGISGTAHVAEQLPYVISCGVAALIYTTIGATLWLSADMRDEWRELRLLRLANEHSQPAAVLEMRTHDEHLDLAPAPHPAPVAARSANSNAARPHFTAQSSR